MTVRRSILNSFVERAYACGLFLYPRGFREAHGEQMRQAVRDALADEPERRFSHFWMLLLDVIYSCFKEHLAMLPKQLAKRPIVVHAIGLGLILSLLGGAGMTTMQQLLRRGADQPQALMVSLAASRLANGESPNEVIPAGHIEIRGDLEPFLIYYDERGIPRTGTGSLDQALPVPPPGVFEYLRTHPDDSFTWQPRHDVRIATVMQRIQGPHAGFLLAGRSLLLVEKQESLLYHLSVVSWLVVLLLLTLGAALLSRHARKQSEPAAD